MKSNALDDSSCAPAPGGRKLASNRILWLLPGRLKRELAAVARALVEETDLAADPLCAPHAAWAEGLRARYGSFEEATVRAVLQQEVSQAFAQVLECAGVFKWDETGRAAWERFLAQLA